jgi:branched-chain amino acid transport system ATP-binding protein
VSALLELNGVSKQFGGVAALADVDLDVREGEIFGLIGPNGAGKTTLVSVTAGQMPATRGRIVFEGRDLSRAPAHSRARLGIGRTFQNVRLFPDQTVHENVQIGAYLRGRSGAVEAMLRLPRVHRDERAIRREADEALELVGLGARANVLASRLSTGEQRLAELAKAVAMRPKLLFLDEPAAGLNPTEESRLAASIRALAQRATLVLIEHHLDLVMSLCDRIAVLNFGRLLAIGTPAEIRANDAVVEAYLGAPTDA